MEVKERDSSKNLKSATSWLSFKMTNFHMKVDNPNRMSKHRKNASLPDIGIADSDLTEDHSDENKREADVFADRCAEFNNFLRSNPCLRQQFVSGKAPIARRVKIDCDEERASPTSTTQEISPQPSNGLAHAQSCHQLKPRSKSKRVLRGLSRKPLKTWKSFRKPPSSRKNSSSLMNATDGANQNLSQNGNDTSNEDITRLCNGGPDRYREFDKLLAANPELCNFLSSNPNILQFVSSNATIARRLSNDGDGITKALELSSDADSRHSDRIDGCHKLERRSKSARLLRGITKMSQKPWSSFRKMTTARPRNTDCTLLHDENSRREKTNVPRKCQGAREPSAVHAAAGKIDENSAFDTFLPEKPNIQSYVPNKATLVASMNNGNEEEKTSSQASQEKKVPHAEKGLVLGGSSEDCVKKMRGGLNSLDEPAKRSKSRRLLRSASRKSHRAWRSFRKGSHDSSLSIPATDTTEGDSEMLSAKKSTKEAMGESTVEGGSKMECALSSDGSRRSAEFDKFMSANPTIRQFVSKNATIARRLSNDSDVHQ